MIFERNETRQFLINGTVIPNEIFLSLEPDYTEPEDVLFIRYEQGVGRKIRTKTKEYFVEGNWGEGDRYISRFNNFLQASTSLMIEQQIVDKEMAQARYDSLTERDKRRLEYPPLEDLVIALWENLIEKKTKKLSGVENIQKLRKAVKAKYPTENTDAISTNETETD